MDPTDFEFLTRLLSGYRVRHEEQTWSVSRVALAAGGGIELTIQGATERTLSIDLPAGFDPRDNEHRVWLLGLVERALVEKSSA